ncbi:hypothetical protein JIN85_15750 [Luteolibacter pohnpeiensis]|uniref:Uncharacterized protein n=1 Tax=Luteolibacter pohnpeiensis TaxID=454153 RepID=A0A934SD00_9BACT|nr:hypothetical protein [Luteolibacter pohnpeiensis]MBK1883872.1 hypothetical protein [Luteolibacter pohnpeiensis]
MTTREEAAEQLKIIRTMMERATIFRALSGETALIGGAAALAAAWFSEGKIGWSWAVWWLGGLALVMIFNIVQVNRTSTAHGKPFWSSGLKLALKGAIPPIVSGGFLGLLFVRSGSDVPAACIWILHYGLALLAIREFAPKSMTWLGWAFVIFGVSTLAGFSDAVQVISAWMKGVNGSHLMAIAFGGFHIIYGGVILLTDQRHEAH